MLARTERLTALVGEYHPYYATHAENRLFTVITQSCDLVQRDGGVAARYIALAPVRPLRHILRREFDAKLHNVGSGCQPFGGQRTRTSVEQFLQRLLNNNEPPFFYFEAEHRLGISEDMCAMLALPIAFKPEHYSIFLEAKIAGITDVFQAKLGWLVGQMYSRVGTPDLLPATLSERVDALIDGAAVWLDDGQAKALRRLVEQEQLRQPGRPIDLSVLTRLLESIPQRKAQVIEAVLAAATTAKLIPEGKSKERFTLRRALEQEPALAAAIGGRS